MTEDYYALLEIKHGATQDEVEQAYQRLEQEMRADANPDPETQERFKEITQAYDVLRDPDERLMYDLADHLLHQDDPWPQTYSPRFTDTDIVHVMGEGAAFILDTMVRFDNLEAAKRLLAGGTVPFTITLDRFVHKGLPEWVSLCIDKGAKPKPWMLHHAVENRNMEVAKALLAGGAVPAKKTLRLVKKRKWTEWEKMLADALPKDKRRMPSLPAVFRKRRPAP